MLLSLLASNIVQASTKTLLAAVTDGGGGNAGSNAELDLAGVLVLKNGRKVSEVFKTPADLLNLIVANAFVAGGIFIFVLIIMAGFKLLGNDSKGMEEAKTLIWNAGIGFGLLFGAFWIVQIVQFITGVKILF